MKLSGILSFRWVMTLMAALQLLLTMVSCSSDDEPQPQPTGRTVLVYMVARNSLGSWDFDGSDLREMQSAASAGLLGNNRLIVFHSGYGAAPQLKEVKSSGTEVLKTYPSDMVVVDADAMNEVIADVKSMAPALSYGIVLWSHADGWVQTGIGTKQPQSVVRPRAFGDDRGKHMNVTDLADVLEGKDFDFIYFDCCFMGGIEVMYELRNAAPLIVASASELPSDGMPYDRTLPFLMADKADLVGAASTTFGYYNALEGWNQTCTMSVIRTEGLMTLADAVRELYSHKPVLPEEAEVQAFVSAGSDFCQSGGEQFFDLRHYLSCLTKDVEKWDPEQDARLAYEMAVGALNDCVAYQAATPYLWKGGYDEVKIDWHCGLSTYIMRDASMADTKSYRDLAWYRDVASALF